MPDRPDLGPAPLPCGPWDARPGVHRDMRALADQMQRCTRGDSRRFRFVHTLGGVLGFLRRHAVSIAVLLALMVAALSAAR
jgi:hypothetical protein